MTNREKLIAAGVRNLRKFGYPDATPENILADYVFRRFFESMLWENDNLPGAKELLEEVKNMGDAKA